MEEAGHGRVRAVHQDLDGARRRGAALVGAGELPGDPRRRGQEVAVDEHATAGAREVGVGKEVPRERHGRGPRGLGAENDVDEFVCDELGVGRARQERQLGEDVEVPGGVGWEGGEGEVTGG